MLRAFQGNWTNLISGGICVIKVPLYIYYFTESYGGGGACPTAQGYGQPISVVDDDPSPPALDPTPRFHKPIFKTNGLFVKYFLASSSSSLFLLLYSTMPRCLDIMYTFQIRSAYTCNINTFNNINNMSKQYCCNSTTNNYPLLHTG